MTYYEKIAARRKELKFTQDDMAKYLEISRQAYSLYETGKRRISFETALKIGEKLDISLYDLGLDYVSEKSTFMDISPLKKKRYPLLGVVACGEPTIDEINEYFDFDDIDADFALKCKGDSMIGAHIYDGDIVLIKRCEIVDNGQIAAVAVDSDGECTLKKVYFDKEREQLTLMPCNPAYDPIIIHGTALNEVRIIGRAVGFFSKL